MAEFNIRSDSVDVEQIMRQIRARIREKRGVDYTEQQIQDLASVKLERFLDPKGVRSDLVDQFRRSRGLTPPPPNYAFEDTTLVDSNRAVVRLIRRVLRPILKLLFNPNPLIQALHIQSQLNAQNAQQFSVREEMDALYYEVVHNLVLELTRLGIETKNLKMRLESISSRLDFDERRARALEGVVQPRPGAATAREPSAPRPQATAAAPAAPSEQGGPPPQEASGRPRRRKRRRGRRGGRPSDAGQSAGRDAATPSAQPDTASAETGPPSAGEPEDGPDVPDL